VKRISYIIPVVLFILNVLIKLIHFPMKTEFYSDAALRYRYARIFAEEGQLPDPDKKILHPEGISPWDLIHPTMDAIIGLSYRVLKIGDFFSYTRVFIILFSSLTVFVFYFFAKYLFRKDLWAWVLTFMYAVGPPAYWRVVGNYLREEFALPFLFLGCLFLFKALGNRTRGHLFLGGSAFGIGLIIWHMSQFFYAVVVVFIVLYTILKPEIELRWHDIVTFFVPVFILSCIWPPLVKKFFILSPQSFSIYALIFYLILVERFGKKWQELLVFIVFIVLAIGFNHVIGYAERYGHVFQTIMYKMYFLLQKPSDPYLLPTDARLIWMGPFASPGIVTSVFAFGIYPLIFILSLISAKEKTQKPFFYPVLFFVIIFFILYLLIVRLQVFFFFFLILGIGFLFYSKKKWILILFLVVGSLDVYKGLTFSTWYQRLLPQFRREWGLRFGAFGNEWHYMLAWVSKNIPENEAILTDIDFGAMMLEKTNRPILIQPVYENSIARKRVLIFVDAFYEPEDSMFSLAQKFEFRHILYHKRFFLDHSLNSNRYLTCNTEFDSDWISYRFQFFPDSLHHFHKIVQTTSFAIYSLDSTLSRDVKYSPFFDCTRYNIKYDEEPQKEVIEKVEHNYLALLNLYNGAIRSIGSKDYRSALDKIRAIHNRIPQLERSRALEALCYQNLNETVRARSLYVTYLLENPGDRAVAMSAFRILQAEEKIKVAKAMYRVDTKDREVYQFLMNVLKPQEFQRVIE